MTQTSYERKYEVRLQFAIDNLRICDDMGLYAVVPSTSGGAKPYIVGINEDSLYSYDCSCYAGQHNTDCIHRLAVDRALDARREAALKVKEFYDRDRCCNILVCQCREYAQLRTCKHIKAVAVECEPATVAVAEVLEAASEAVTSQIEAAAVAGDRTYAQAVGYGSGRPTYGTCGHLSRNEHEDCGACKSKQYR